MGTDDLSESHSPCLPPIARPGFAVRSLSTPGCGNRIGGDDLDLVWRKSHLKVPTLPEKAHSVDRERSGMVPGEKGISRRDAISAPVRRYSQFSGLYTRSAGNGLPLPVRPISPVPAHALGASCALLISKVIGEPWEIAFSASATSRIKPGVWRPRRTPPRGIADYLPCP